jgi:hypothetical protein
MAILNKILKMFFNKKTQNDITRIKIFGLTLYKKIKKDYQVEKFLLGLKFYQKIDIDEILGILNGINNKDRNENLIGNHHQKIFSDYKNIYQDQEAVLLATGPSLNFFNHNINAIYAGCNSAFMYDNRLDFLFMQDYNACRNYIECVPKYIPDSCEKFYGYTWLSHYHFNRVIPESLAIKHNAKRYYTSVAFDIKENKLEDFSLDLSFQPLKCFGSIVFPTMQFLLYTNPRKIYLVGCDCSSSHFDNTSLADPNTKDLSYLINRWKKLKLFIERYYPETEIISVNPIGLKGIFKDVYTLSFLNSNPDLKAELGDNIEILEDNAVKSR